MTRLATLAAWVASGSVTETSMIDDPWLWLTDTASLTVWGSRSADLATASRILSLSRTPTWVAMYWLESSWSCKPAIAERFG